MEVMTGRLWSSFLTDAKNMPQNIRSHWASKTNFIGHWMSHLTKIKVEKEPVFLLKIFQPSPASH
jgi:hypothetical protein